MTRLALLCVVALAIGCARSPRHAAPAPDNRNCPVRWNDGPPLLTSAGAPAYVEAPTAFATGRGILLLGQPAFLWATPDAFNPPGVIADTAAYIARQGERIGLAGVLLSGDGAMPLRPPTAEELRQYVARRRHDRAIAVVWQSNDDQPPVHLRYAEWRDGRWSAPVELLSAARRFDWTEASPELILAGDDVHIVTGYQDERRSGIAYVRRVRGKWSTTITLQRGLADMATGALVGADSILVVFAAVGDPAVREPNGQHLFAVRAAVRDTAWPAPTRIQWSGLDGVRYLRLYRSPLRGTQLDLLWARVPEAGGGPDALNAMRSRDGGVTWEPQVQLVLPHRATWLTQVQDAGGSVHVVTAGGPPDSTSMYDAQYMDGAWHSLVPLPPRAVASAPGLSDLGAAGLFLAWGEARPATPGEPAPVAPVTRYAFIRRACVE